MWDGTLQGDVLAALGFTGVGSKAAREAMAKVSAKMTATGLDAKQHALIGCIMRYIDDRADQTAIEHLRWYLTEVLVPNLEQDDANGQFVGANDLTVIGYGEGINEAPEFQPLRDYVQRRRAMGFQLRIQYIDLMAEDAEGEVGLDLRGVPVGTPEYVRRSLDKRMEKTRKELEEIERMPTQHRMLLLRFCITAELNFWCRSLAPSQNRDAIVDIERRIARLLRNAMLLPVHEEAIEALLEQYGELMFGDELDANEISRRWDEDASFREAITRAMHNLPIARG